MKKIKSYDEMRNTCEEILKQKQQATSRQICDDLNKNYKLGNKIEPTPKKVSSYLKKYPNKKGKNKQLIFISL